ncbi:hypothetical protein QTP70_003394, partial [Hemibagrus guttatus]
MIAEELILPAALDMVSIMINDKSAVKLKSVPMSNNTVASRLRDISQDLEDQLIEKTSDLCKSIQLHQVWPDRQESVPNASHSEVDLLVCFGSLSCRRTQVRLGPRKSARPDNIPGRVLRERAEQLADGFTDIFNISLSNAVVPTCLKTTTIVPVPKKSTVSCLNVYRPVALTPIVMKCFQRLDMRHIKTQLPPSLDPLPFANHPNRSTDDAITTILHLSLTHLDNKDTYLRMLFIDFSSAFNTIRLSLPSITDMYTTHCIRKANSIVDDPTHTLFILLPSGK